MRWPLRNQIILPMVCVMVTTLFAVSLLNAYFSVRRTRLRIGHELTQVAGTLSDANFPLTDIVLRKMRGLSGAEFVLMESGGQPIASSSPEEMFRGLVQAKSPGKDSSAIGKPITLGGGRFFHTTLKLRSLTAAGEPTILHILYPEESYNEAWRNAVRPPLLAGTVAILFVVTFALGIASRVTRPLRQLQSQVGEIAEGEFLPVPIPRRDDEIADLSRSINRMAQRLDRYERDVRQNERLRTLGQLGGGIAHQMRNSVTGCSMAVELHARNCQQRDEQDSLDVARRQLELMERYLQRFLSLGRNTSEPHTATDLVAVVEGAVSLVGPTARHAGVQSIWQPPAEPVVIKGNADLLEQLLVNLMLNAIEAVLRAETISEKTDATASSFAKKVTVTLSRNDDEIRLEVRDTGDGPDESVRDQLFEPFVTGKLNGVGLGLSVAREIAIAHHGALRWQRCDATTSFIVSLPVLRGLAENETAPAAIPDLFKSGA